MMIENLRARLIISAVVFFGALFWVAPNFVKFSEKDWWFTKSKLVYGLDIQGGLHLVMGVDTEEVLAANTRRLASSIPQDLKNRFEITIPPGEVVNAERGTIHFKVSSEQQADRLVEHVQDPRYLGRTLQVIETTPTMVEVRYLEIFMRDFRQSVIDRSIETIRNRIDEFGVAEPSITAQGENRILIQLPGIQDAERAKELINKTARLDFQIVNTEVNQAQLAQWIEEAEQEGGFTLGKEGLRYTEYVNKVNEALKERLPKDTIVYFEKDPAAKTLEAGKIPFLLSTVDVVSGADLQDAVATLDPQTSQPIVSFEFNIDGTKAFADLTTKHEGKLMAIVLDRVVQSAPVIQEPITQGQGRITMGSGDRTAALKDAELISMALRSGALPATLTQLEERTVGPSLGADAIAKGSMAAVVGGILVIIFMLIYYKGFGVVADIVLLFNILLILAVLTSLGATLTLPGVAGIALTVGMAVDANVIINERIKEELAKGSSLAAAAREGYQRAFSAIIDGNITTAAVCVVLMYFGTGPVRGFAVTLLIGIGATLFTAVFVSRALVEWAVSKRKWKLAI